MINKAIFFITVTWVIALVVVPVADYLGTAMMHPEHVTDGELIRDFVSNFLLLTSIYLPVMLLLLTTQWAFRSESRKGV